MGKFLRDLSVDTLNVTADTASALLRFALALAFLMYVAELTYHEAVEPAALLGMTAYFERSRAYRTGDDIRRMAAQRAARVRRRKEKQDA